jgi:hypothetical protein
LSSDEHAHRQDHPPVTTLGWDSHNYVTLAVDADDQIHLSGNMHVAPLVYFRTTKPMDIDTFRWAPQMTGQRETRCTYPRYFSGPRGELLFTYRDGGSGSGDQIYNRYDLKTRTWSRLLDEPLFSGKGKMNAYVCGPLQDRAGTFHISWVWRDTPDCATNHDVGYAKSKDLIHWTASDGKPLPLPITIETGEIVDPVPAGGGLINSNLQMGFDFKDRPILTYHKFDAQGNTQIYNARLEDRGWRISQASDWAYRWEFHGGGSIPNEIQIGAVTRDCDGRLIQSYRHCQYGSGSWRLDEATLKPMPNAENKAQANGMPPELNTVKSTFPNMAVYFASDLGRADESGVQYLLRWEALPPNRDQPYIGEVPKPSVLQAIKLRAPSSVPIRREDASESRR